MRLVFFAFAALAALNTLAAAPARAQSRPALMLKEMADSELPPSLTAAADGSLAIASVEFGASADSSYLKGSGGAGGGAGGKPIPSSLTIKRVADKGSVAFWGKMVTGDRFAKLIIALGGGVTLTLESAFVTNIQVTNDQANQTNESISVVFKTIRYEVQSQDAAGKMSKPKGFTWDVTAAKLTTF